MAVVRAHLAGGLGAAASTTIATTTVIATARARASCCGVGGGMDLAGGVVPLNANLCTDEVCIKTVKAHRIITCSHRRDEALVVRSKAGDEHVAKDFLIGERAANGRYGVGKPLHLLKVLSRRHVLLRHVGELITHLHGSRTVLRRKHLQCVLDLTSSILLGHLPKQVLAHGGR